jgi:hypothetical protein
MIASDSVKELLALAVELKETGEISNEDYEELVKLNLPTEVTEIEVATIEKEQEPNTEGDIRSKLRDMGIPQRVKLAMFGNNTCRMLLILDANKLVQEAVLKNPQLQEREVLDFARSTNVSDNVLRRIATSKTWMKSYQAKVNLVSNPKAPSDVALKWIKYLRQAELKRLTSSKNVSQVVSLAARKRIAEIQKG